MYDTNKKKILIVEDESILQQYLKNIVTGLGHETIGIAPSETEAVRLIKETNPDLIFLDINLRGDFEGIKIGAQIKTQFKIPFIYITSHSAPEIVKKALPTQPSGYVLKPFTESDIYVALELALNTATVNLLQQENNRGEKLANDSIFIRVKGTYKKIPLTDILYVKAEGNYTLIYTLEGKYVLRGTLSEIIENFLTDSFYKVHKSYAINIKRINDIDQDVVKVEGEEIPIEGDLRQGLINKVNPAA